MRHLAMVRRVLARRPWIYWTIVAAVAAGGAIATASVARRRRRRTGTLGRHRDRARRHPRRGGRRAAGRSDRRAPLSDGDDPARCGDVARSRRGRPPPTRRRRDRRRCRRRRDHGTALADPARLARRSRSSRPWPSGATVGDHVVVASEGVRLADDALIVGHGDGVTIVAVPDDEAPIVAAASSSTGGVALLLRP